MYSPKSITWTILHCYCIDTTFVMLIHRFKSQIFDLCNSSFRFSFSFLNHIISLKLQTVFQLCIFFSPNLRPGRSFTFHKLRLFRIVNEAIILISKAFYKWDLNLSSMTSSKIISKLNWFLFCEKLNVLHSLVLCEFLCVFFFSFSLVVSSSKTYIHKELWKFLLDISKYNAQLKDHVRSIEFFTAWICLLIHVQTSLMT